LLLGAGVSQILIDGQDLDVTIKWSRWVCPDKWAGFVTVW